MGKGPAEMGGGGKGEQPLQPAADGTALRSGHGTLCSLSKPSISCMRRITVFQKEHHADPQGHFLIFTTDGRLPEAKSQVLHLEIRVLTPSPLAITGLS